MTQRRDVAVVGGGLLGAATAYHLARADAHVVLLEKDELNSHASGQNAGSLHFQLEYRMIEHGDELAAQFARHLPLALEAQSAWSLLSDELQDDVEVVQRGGLMCAHTDEDLAVLRRKNALEAEWGLMSHLLEGSDLREVAPYLSPAVRAAAFCPTEGHANPRLVGPAFARAATRAGAEIRTRTCVVALGRREGRWLVGVAGGEPVVADAVVFATGIWTPELGAMADVRLPVVPVALSMIATERTSELVPHLVQHVGRRLSLKQAHDGNVLIGGGWASRLVQAGGTVDLAARPELRLDSLAGNARAAVHVVPAVGGLAVLRAWSGVAPVTVDQLPLVGAIPRRSGLFVVAGGPAFTLAPVLSKLVSDAVLGRQSTVPLADYDPARFAHLMVV